MARNKDLTDEEILEIIRKFYNGGFSNDEEDCAMMDLIESIYPCGNFSDLIFSDNGLSPEQVLEEAKKQKPVLL